jgi:hypothetical protein
MGGFHVSIRGTEFVDHFCLAMQAIAEREFSPHRHFPRIHEFGRYFVERFRRFRCFTLFNVFFTSGLFQRPSGVFMFAISAVSS